MRVFCRGALFGKRLLLAAMQILAVGGILGATFRVGEAPSAMENRLFAMASGSKESRACLEIEMLLCSALVALGYEESPMGAHGISGIENSTQEGTYAA